MSRAAFEKAVFGYAPPDPTPAQLDAWVAFKMATMPKSNDARAFQQYDPSNSLAKRQIGSSAVGVVLPGNPYRQQAERKVVENVAQAMTDPMMATFAGVGAKTADMLKLDRAKKMIAGLERGTPEFMAADRAAWKETGWTHAFPDGKPRFEISDHAATLLNRNIRNEMSRTNEDIAIGVMKHDPLYAAHPSTELIPIRSTLDDNSYLGDTIRIAGLTDGTGNIAVLPKNKSTTLHELQHAIQEREGFARGGSPETMNIEWMQAKNNQDFYSTVDALAREAEASFKGDVDAAAKALNEIDIPVTQEHIDTLMNIGAKEAAKRSATAQDQLKTFGGGMGMYHDPGMNLYKRLAGEAESRLTQKRMDLTPAQRAEQYPIDEFDVPVEQQIVRYNI